MQGLSEFLDGPFALRDAIEALVPEAAGRVSVQVAEQLFLLAHNYPVAPAKKHMGDPQ